MASFSANTQYSRRPWSRESTLPVFEPRNAPYNIIHSSTKRQKLCQDGTLYGKLYKGKLHDNSIPNHSAKEFLPKEAVFYPRTYVNQSVSTENYKVEEDFNGLSTKQKFAPRLGTAPAEEQNPHSTTKLNRTGSFSSQSYKLSRPTAGTTEKQFQDQINTHKYEFLVFREAGTKKIMSMLKFDSNQLSLLPHDQRKVIIDGILRDFFLNMNSHNSQYIICKNKANNDFTIHFTGGKVVPFCKICGAAVYFELSKYIGFRVICSSDFCTVKVLHHNNIKDGVKKELWTNDELDYLNQSLNVKKVPRANINISKMIVSGRFKSQKLHHALKEVPENAIHLPRNSIGVALKGSLRSLTYTNEHERHIFNDELGNSLSRDVFMKPGTARLNHSPPLNMNQIQRPTTTNQISRSKYNLNQQLQDETAVMRSHTINERVKPQITDSSETEFVPLKNFFERHSNALDAKEPINSLDPRKSLDLANNNSSFLNSSLGDEMKYNELSEL